MYVCDNGCNRDPLFYSWVRSAVSSMASHNINKTSILFEFLPYPSYSPDNKKMLQGRWLPKQIARRQIVPTKHIEQFFTSLYQLRMKLWWIQCLRNEMLFYFLDRGFITRCIMYANLMIYNPDNVPRPFRLAESPKHEALSWRGAHISKNLNAQNASNSQCNYPYFMHAHRTWDGGRKGAKLGYDQHKHAKCWIYMAAT